MLEFSPYSFADRLLFTGIALLACLILGSLTFRKFFALPTVSKYLRGLVLNFDHKLNRSHRSDSERKVRGAIVLLVMVFLAGIVSGAFSALTAAVPMGWWAEAALLAIFVPARLIHDQSSAVLKRLKANELKEAREEVQAFTLQDTKNLDQHALTRATIEYTAGSLADRVISPLFWYILFGLPGFVASKIITESALVLDYDSRRHRNFGQAAGAFEQILNFFPARIAGLLLIFASLFVPKAHPRKAFAGLLNDSSGIHPPRKGVPIATTAGALGITLGGPRSVQGYLVKDAWIGSGTAKASLSHLRKNMFLYTIACLLNVAVIAILLFALAR
ncbi:MAG: hypothetical protein FJX23_01010 [Alphaproteobacteria bacterium]|nr:hypothetical protein [Alphaproteobacteria bacterium]